MEIDSEGRVIRFMLIVFAVLAGLFWVASGGSGFERQVIVQEEPAEAAPPAPEASPVTEALSAALAEPAEPAPAKPEPEPVAAPTPVEPEPTPEPAPAPSRDIRFVDATRVNMRSGPSTDYRVVDTLGRDTEVEVIETDYESGEPWVHLRVIESGLEGWMAERFLAE